MRTAIYIVEDAVQVVLTPANDFEKDILAKAGEIESAKVVVGTFYEDEAAGWARVMCGADPLPGLPDERGRSLILRLKHRVK